MRHTREADTDTMYLGLSLEASVAGVLVTMNRSGIAGGCNLLPGQGQVLHLLGRERHDGDESGVKVGDLLMACRKVASLRDLDTSNGGVV